MVLESGADFLFLVDGHKWRMELINAVVRDMKICFAVKATTYIDCTGDGTLSVMAGAPYEKGDEKGRMMPATLCSLWTNIDWNRAIVEVGLDPDNRKLSQAFADGVAGIAGYKVCLVCGGCQRIWAAEISAMYLVWTVRKRKDLTRGILDARKRMQEYEYYYTYLEGYERSFLVSTGANLGIRD